MFRSIFRFTLVAIAAAGCASHSSTTSTAAGTSASTSRSGSAASPNRRDREVITRQELDDPALRSLSVLDVVRTLRPNFLIVRGRAASSSDPDVPGQIHGSINYKSIIPFSELRNIPNNGLVEIRYLDTGAAMQRFGTLARDGPVIVVVTN